MAEPPISAAEIAEVSHAIKQIAFDVDRLATSIAGKVTKTKDEIIKASDDVSKRQERSLDIIEQRFKRFHEEEIFRINMGGEAWEKMADRVERKWKQVGAEMQRQLTEARGLTGRIGETLGMSGANSMKTFAGSKMNELTAGLPFGGLLGLMLFGRMKEAEFAAQGRKIANQFLAVGDVSKGTAAKMAADGVKIWSSWMADPGELAAITGAFAQMGVSGGEAMRKAGFEAKGFGDTVFDAAFAMDTLTKSATGSFATAIGSAMQASGADIKAATADVTALGLELRNTGANVGQFVSALMQSQSGLRVQRQSVGDLREQYGLLREAFHGLGGSREFQAQSTLKGVQAIAGGAGNMSEGLSAFLGQRIGARTGKSVGGVDALIAMQEGQVGKGGAFLGEVTRELGRLAKESAGDDPNRQKFFLQKVAPSLGVEGARAVLAINEQMEKDLAKGATSDEVIKSHLDDLNKAFSQRAEESSPYEKAMRQLTTQLVTIGAEMLKVTITGIMNAGDNMKDLLTIMSPFSSAEESSAASGRVARRTASSDASFAKMWGAMENGGNVMKGLFGTTFGKELTDRASASAQDLQKRADPGGNGAAFKQARDIMTKYGVHGNAAVEGASAYVNAYENFNKTTNLGPRLFGPDSAEAAGREALQSVVNQNGYNVRVIVSPAPSNKGSKPMVSK